jgi:outer membrane protein TolC
MAKKQTKAVRKIEKAVRKAVKKGVSEHGAVEKAVSQGMAKGHQEESRRAAASAKADLRASKIRVKLAEYEPEVLLGSPAPAPLQHVNVEEAQRRQPQDNGVRTVLQLGEEHRLIFTNVLGT